MQSRTGSSAESRNSSRPKTCTPSSKTSFTDKSSSRKQSTGNESIKEQRVKKRVRPQTATTKHCEPNLLGQLNVDKIYLENLLKSPGKKYINHPLLLKIN